MKRSLIAALLSVAVLGCVVNAAADWFRRERLFTRLGAPQTLSASELVETRIGSLFPPRLHYVYNGRIGSNPVRIESGRRLGTDTGYPVRYLSAAGVFPLEQLAGRTDRLTTQRDGVWFAYGSSVDSRLANLFADLPWPEAAFYLGCAFLAIRLLLGEGLSARRARREAIIHPVLRDHQGEEPATAPASSRIKLGERPPALPEPEARDDGPALSLPRRSPTKPGDSD